MSASSPPLRAAPALLGRTFLHPALDYALIGGGLSLAVTALVVLTPSAQSVGQMTPAGGPGLLAAVLPLAVLASNSAHLAASTVRLYTKPGSFASLPFVTLSLPLVMLVVLTLCLLEPAGLGRHLHGLFLSWSPYHYAAQGYGIAVAYAHRSGCALGATHKRWLRGAAMLPFVHLFLTGQGSGLDWLAPGLAEAFRPQLTALGSALVLPAFAAPALVYAWIWRETGRPLPLISLLAILVNAVWFLTLNPLDAFLYATFFHGLQYLAIVIVFHVKDQMAVAGNRLGPLRHAIRFYGLSLLLGYALYQCLPGAFAFAGFGVFESVLLVTAVINVHHFIVDAFIWHFRGNDSNRAVVELGHEALA